MIFSRIQGDPICLMEVEIEEKQNALSLGFFPFLSFLICVLRLHFQGRNVIHFPHDYVLEYNHTFPQMEAIFLKLQQFGNLSQDIFWQG